MLCNICAQNFFNRKTKSFPFRFWQQYNNHIISNCNHRTMFAKFPFIFKLFTNTSEWHLRQIKVEIIIFITTADFFWPHAITKTNDGKLNSRIYEKYQNAFHSLVKYILCVWRMGMIWYIFGPKIISFFSSISLDSVSTWIYVCNLEIWRKNKKRRNQEKKSPTT